MICKIDNISLLGVRPKDYNGKKYYFASIFDRGYVTSVACSEEFFKAHYAECKNAGESLVNLKSVGAEIYFYKNQPKIKLL